FCPDKPGAERARHFVSDHDPANRWRRHQLNSLTSILLSYRASEAFGSFRKLKHERALQVDCAVPTAGQLKVTLQKRARRSKLIDDLFSVQSLSSLSWCMLQFEFECRLTRI